MRILRNRGPAVLGLLLAAAACDTPTGPSEPSGIEPNMAISDAAHGGSNGLYFLPPMVKNPKKFRGSFDASLEPVVRICRWVDDACAGSDIVIDGRGKGAQRLKLKGRPYGALWKDTDDLEVGAVYRLRVYADAAATAPLGFADLRVVRKNRDRKRISSEFLGITRGKPFHIKFRIEKGAQPELELDDAPTVISNTPVDGATGVSRSANIELTFSEAVNVTGHWFLIVCTASGTRAPEETTISGGPTSFTIDPDVGFAVGETCEVTVVAAEVTDQDTDDPPDNMAQDHVFEFTVIDRATPAPVNDGPAPNSVPGDTLHAHMGVPILISMPGLLANDDLGVPAGAITSFGGGSLGGSVTSFAAGQSVPVDVDGLLIVNANGGMAFKPTTGFSGAFTFHYRVTNSEGSGDATVTIFVGPRS